jgi:hypothetical protein
MQQQFARRMAIKQASWRPAHKGKPLGLAALPSSQTSSLVVTMHMQGCLLSTADINT